MVFDLGYFKLTVLQKITEIGAFFVSRYLHGTDVFVSKGGEFKKLNLVKLLKKLDTNGAFDCLVYLGSQCKLPVRLVAVRLPQVVINQRIRNLRAKAQKKGRSVSKQEKVLAKYSMFVTNTNAELLSASEITQVYRLRWSIELIFKQFKSTLKIHEWNHGNVFRIQCKIMGTLIIATIIMKFHGLAQYWSYKIDKKEISIEKIFKFFRNNSQILFNAVTLSYEKLKAFFNETFIHIQEQCKKETRTSRPSTIKAVFIKRKNFKVKKITNSYLRKFSH